MVNDATLRLKGSETLSLTMDINSGTVEYIGAGTATTYTIKEFGATDYYHLVINDANAIKATFQLGATMVIGGNLTVSGGTFNATTYAFSSTGSGTLNGGTYLCSNNTITFGSGLTVSSGVFTGSSGHVDINGSLTISGGTYTSNSNSTYIYGHFNQSGGTFTHNSGTLVFDGVANQNVTTSSTLFNFIMNQSNGITLLSNIAMSGTLSLNSGKISIGNYNFTMNSVAVLSGGSSTSFVFTGGTGQFKWASCAATNTKVFPVGHTNSSAGYTPLTITFNTGHTTDAFGVAAYNSVRSNGASTGGTEYTNSVVKTTWNISETVAGGANATLTFQWNGTDEGSAFSRSSCRMAHHDGTVWQNVGSLASATGSNPYTLTYSNYTGSFSPFGINGSGGPLPVEWLYFNVAKEGSYGQLTWATATEVNNDYFNIEKSVDGKIFKTIGTIYGAGNSQQILRYAFIDSNLVTGANYYRLKQVDYNGAFEYSTIQVINNSIAHVSINPFKLWPVPAHNKLNLEFSTPTDGYNTVSVLNQMGHPVKSFDTEVVRGLNTITLELDDIPTGIYFLKLENLDKSFTCQRFSIIK